MSTLTNTVLPQGRVTPDSNVIRYLDAVAEQSPDKLALIWGACRSITFGELARQVEAVAGGLRQLGLRKGDCAFLFIPLSVEMYVAMFAVIRLGGIAVFLDSWARREELAACAADVEPRCLIADSRALPLLHASPHLKAAPIQVTVDGGAGNGAVSLEALRQAVLGGEAAAVALDDSALVTFTTGSSGKPKGADRTHRFLAAQRTALGRILPYTDSDFDLPVFPIFSLNNLAAGVTTVLPRIDLAAPRDDDGQVLLDQIVGEGVTCCTLSPSLLRKTAAAARSQGVRLDRLRRVATGGAPISKTDVESFLEIAPGADIHILYGSTEVEPIAHLLGAEMPVDLGTRGVCVGYPSADLRTRLLKLDKNPIELGSDGWNGRLAANSGPGELIVAGGHVCPGYYRNPEAFRRSKIRDLDGTVWHRTGDMCRLDTEGRLWFEGRVHSTIVRNGELLFPVGPESLLRQVPGVKAGAYVGLPDDHLGERVAVAVQLDPERDRQDALADVRRVLDQSAVVWDEIYSVVAMPLDARHHSKVDYSILKRMILNRDDAVAGPY